MLDTSARAYFQPLIAYVAHHFQALKISPNVVTGMAFVTGIAATLAFGTGFSLLSLMLLWFSGLLDAVDGTLARMTKRVSPLGTLFDLISDRVVEVTFIIATALRFPESQLVCVFLMGAIIFSFSIFLVVGILVRNESQKSFHYQAGLAERTETFIVFSLIILMPQYAREIFYGFTVMIVFTGAQRFCEALRFFK